MKWEECGGESVTTFSEGSVEIAEEKRHRERTWRTGPILKPYHFSTAAKQPIFDTSWRVACRPLVCECQPTAPAPEPLKSVAAAQRACRWALRCFVAAVVQRWYWGLVYDTCEGGSWWPDEDESGVCLLFSFVYPVDFVIYDKYARVRCTQMSWIRWLS